MDELKAQISHMLKRSEEVGNEPSEFMNIPKKEEKEDRGWYLEYDASDPTCNLPVPEEKAPHGAGSYHDPEHHNKLMDAVEDYVKPYPYE